MVSVVTNLSAADLNLYRPEAFRYGLEGLTLPSTRDPNIPASDLNLGFTQPGGRWQTPTISPTESPLFEWSFPTSRVDQNPVAHVRPVNGGPTEEVRLTPRAMLSRQDLRWLRTHELIVDPVVAAGAVYKIERITNGMVQQDCFDVEANRRIIRNLATAGQAEAIHLDIPSYHALDESFAVAAAMDTAGRTPAMMSQEFIEYGINFYGTEFPGVSMWIGTGSEHIAAENRRHYALRDGAVPLTEYIEARRKQIELVFGVGQRPILFPDAMQDGLGDAKNIELIRTLLGTKPGEIVAHKLGSPFLSSTDYLTLEVLKHIADLAAAVKSSDPRFPAQIDDYLAVQDASRRAAKPVVLYTGDDRGFPFCWELGARQQLQRGGQHTTQRNGFTFVSDANISGLLGYIGLNPRQTIVAIIRLSQWYHEMKKGTGANVAKRDQYLDAYWELMAPAMALSTDAFFGKWDPTPAYTWRVETANRFTGVLREGDGHVLPHRQSTWDGPNRQVLASRLFVQMAFCGAITPREMPAIIGANKDLLFSPSLRVD